MSVLDISTEDWTTWRLVIQSPSGWPIEVKVRCPAQAEAERKALLHRRHWTVARDESGNPLIWREGVGK